VAAFRAKTSLATVENARGATVPKPSPPALSYQKIVPPCYNCQTVIPRRKIWIGGHHRTIEEPDAREVSGCRIVAVARVCRDSEEYMGVMMVLKIDASFENGVFVPSSRPGLADRERVRLTIERESRQLGVSRQQIAAETRSGGNPAIMLDYHPDGC
jgi:hypothetical protein